jgi:hypothetical protein
MAQRVRARDAIAAAVAAIERLGRERAARAPH